MTDDDTTVIKLRGRLLYLRGRRRDLEWGWDRRPLEDEAEAYCEVVATIARLEGDLQRIEGDAS